MTLGSPGPSAERQLSDSEFAALRSLAFSRGRVIERDGLSVMGFGEASTISLPNGLRDPCALEGVREVLATLSPAGERSNAIVAMGALPFLPGRATSVVIPAVCIVARQGSAPSAVAVGTRSTEAIDALLVETATEAGGPSPDSFHLASERPHGDFLDRVAAAVSEVRSGRLDKVVMAREVRVEANHPFRQADLLERLRALHPSCTTFALAGFVGATPELLIRRTADEIESHPLAGTAARSGDPESDKRVEAALLASDKDRAEHRAVVEAIADGLRGAVAELDVGHAPEIVELRNVSHLGTHIKGRLAPSPAGAILNALQVVALIHPTPAVAGTPVDLALEYLDKAEDLDRDRYAGALGWMDATGDGEWHLGIRCAIVHGRSARLFAGVGIVADSDPAAELAETQLKLQAFLAAAVRP